MSLFKDIKNELIRYYLLKRTELFEKNGNHYPVVTTDHLHSNSFIVEETKFILTIFPTTVYNYVPEEDNYVREPRDLLMISLLWNPKWSTMKEHKTFMELHVDFNQDVTKIIKISTRGGYLPRNPKYNEIIDYFAFQFKLSGLKKILGNLKLLNVSLI